MRPGKCPKSKMVTKMPHFLNIFTLWPQEQVCDITYQEYQGEGGKSVVLELYGDVIGPSGFIEICKKYRRGSYLKKNYHRCRITTADWDHSFRTYAKFSEKLTFLTP